MAFKNYEIVTQDFIGTCPAGEYRDTEIIVPFGKTVISSGWEDTPPSGLIVHQNTPDISNPRSWQFGLYNPTVASVDFGWVVYVICASI